MEKHFAIYTNNPNTNAQDGTKISTDGSGVLPLTVTLDSTQSETAIIKCAIRCDEGYKIESDTTVYFTGTTSEKWQVAEDNDYANATIAANMCDWQSEISLESVTSVNRVFWVKALSAGESPSNDTSVKIEAIGKVSKE